MKTEKIKKESSGGESYIGYWNEGTKFIFENVSGKMPNTIHTIEIDVLDRTPHDQMEKDAKKLLKILTSYEQEDLLINLVRAEYQGTSIGHDVNLYYGPDKWGDIDVSVSGIDRAFRKRNMSIVSVKYEDESGLQKVNLQHNNP